MAISLSLIRIAQQFFILIAVAAIGYIGFFLWASQKENTTPLPLETMTSSVANALPAEELIPVKPFSLYAAQIKERDLFNVTVKPVEEPKEKIVDGQLPSHLKVVGIALGNPTQVVIENTMEQQTFFIAQGQEKDGIMIDHIDRHAVFLNYQGHLVEVNLRQ